MSLFTKYWVKFPKFIVYNWGIYSQGSKKNKPIYIKLQFKNFKT